MAKPTSTGKPSFASNAGGLLRGAARAMAVGRGKKLGLTSSTPKAKGKAKSR